MTDTSPMIDAGASMSAAQRLEADHPAEARVAYLAIAGSCAAAGDAAQEFQASHRALRCLLRMTPGLFEEEDETYLSPAVLAEVDRFAERFDGAAHAHD